MIDIIIGSIFLAGAAAILFWAVGNRQLWGSSSSGSRPSLTLGGIIKAITKPVTSTWKWSGKFMIIRWFVVIAAVFTGYSYLQSDLAENVYKVVPITQGDGSMLLKFEFPEGLEKKRIRFLETFVVQVSPEELRKLEKTPVIGFKFSGGTLYEYDTLGEDTIRKTISKATGVDVSDGRGAREFVAQKAERKGIVGIVKGSELEWSKPPYTIQILTKPRKIPFSVSSKRSVHYKVLVEDEKE